MTRPSLPVASAEPARPTLLNRGLAASLGSPYVHLVILAIDLDRLSDVVDEVPRAWEVFLLARYLERLPKGEAEGLALATIDHAAELAALGEDPCECLGAPLLLAFGDAAARGRLSTRLTASLAELGIDSRGLSKRMAPWHKQPHDLVRELAGRALTAPLTPPLAELSVRALEALRATHTTPRRAPHS